MNSIGDESNVRNTRDGGREPLDEVEQQLRAILERFMDELAAGQSPHADEWARQHPQFGPELERRFRAAEQLGALARPTSRAATRARYFFGRSRLRPGPDPAATWRPTPARSELA